MLTYLIVFTHKIYRPRWKFYNMPECSIKIPFQILKSNRAVDYAVIFNFSKLRFNLGSHS